MTEIGIKNFQSIGDISLLINGFTAIVGKNNIGKSAIVRAIQSALTNQAGSDFIRKGKKTVEVSFKKESVDIEWKKGSTATYIVNNESYSKLNRAVPQPIIDAGYRKVELGDYKIDPLIANQFSPLFLLNETGSTITEALSVLYKLDVLSIADELCQKELRSTKNIQKTRASDLEQLNKQLEPYQKFDELKKDFKELEKIEEEYNNLKKEGKKVNALLHSTC